MKQLPRNQRPSFRQHQDHSGEQNPKEYSIRDKARGIFHHAPALTTFPVSTILVSPSYKAPQT
jgi:hypothetical protein